MRKHSVLRLAQTLQLLALALWMGAAAMSGVVAAIVFPTMRDLDPTLGSYPHYTGDHALLGAGRIAGTVFLTVDTIQFVCAGIALGSMIFMLLLGYSLCTAGRVVRVIVLCCALGALSYHLFILIPGMQADLRAYWDAAAAGNNPVAETHKDAFLALHATASRSIGAITLLTLGAFVLAVWTGDRPTTIANTETRS